MTTVESEWNDEQRALVLALGQYETQLHAGCGGYLPDTTDPANEGRYRAGVPNRCHKCTAIIQASAAYHDSPQPQALLYPVEHTKGGTR